MDDRQRWWEALRWYHEQRLAIGEEAFLLGLQELSASHLINREIMRRSLRAVKNAELPTFPPSPMQPPTI